MAAAVTALRNKQTSVIERELSAARPQYDSEEDDSHYDAQINAPSVKRHRMPAKHERVLEGVLLKKTDSVFDIWQQRDVVLTKKRLYFGRVGVDCICDSVPLEDIVCIYATNEADMNPENASEHAPVFRDGHVLEIATSEEGFTAGRSYLLKTKDLKVAEEWAEELRHYAKLCVDENAQQAQLKMTTYLRAQTVCREMYSSTFMQGAVAVLIVANFVIRIVDVEVQPAQDTDFAKHLEQLDLAFTIVFALELAMNMFANWTFEENSCMPLFFLDGWNIFDFLVVTISILAAAQTGLPGISILRLLRVFRVLRLFPRLQSLRMIINALTSSILPCANAFMVLLLFTCIYAVVAVTLFQEKDPVQFGNFSASVYSMFQVCTGDGWSTDIVRPLFREDGHVDPLAVCFFVSYILLAGYFLLNIIVAVLLDEFVRSVESERSQMAAAKAIEQAKGTQQSQGALDPLLSLLFRYDTSADLRQKINGLYEFLQPEGGDSLTFPQFVSRIGDLIDLPRMHIAREDWDMIMYGHSDVPSDREVPVSKERFSTVVMAQMSAYCQRQIEAKLLRTIADDNPQSEIFFILKQIMLCIDRRDGVSAAQEHSQASKKLNKVEDKVDSIDEKVDRLSAQMSMLLERMSADADGKHKCEGVSRDLARSAPTQQANLQTVQGLRYGIVESDVVFTLAAAAEIRSTVQDLVETATGVSLEVPAVAHHHGPNVDASNNVQGMSPSFTGFQRTTLDGTMTDSDSSGSLADSSAAVSRRQTRKILAGRSPAQRALVKTVRSPSLVMSQRKGTCKGCRNCMDGLSVVGVMIYDQMFPSTMPHDHVQELKSICITRALKGHMNESVPSDVAAVAEVLIQERLPSGNLAINTNAYLDTPIDGGRHVQRCYLVPKSAVTSMESDNEDASEGMRRSRSCNDMSTGWLPQSGHA